MSRLKNKQIEAARDAPELVQLLLQTGDRLAPRLRERILGFGPAVVPPLIAMLADDDLGMKEAPGEGWGPIHAAALLTELRAPEAIEPMLRVLTTAEWNTILHDDLLQSLPRFGPAVLEPAMALYETATDEDQRFSLCSIVAKLGVRDERVYQALLRELDHDMVMGASHLAEYGDPRALPALSAALDQYEPESDGPLGNLGLGDLIGAIETLGGELTPEQRDKADRLQAADAPQRERWLSLLDEALGRMDLATSPMPGARALASAPRPLRAARKVGRNAPCPCGSGKKYKKCCLGKEE